MPGSPRSLQITNVYRARLNALADRLGALTERYWQGITLDSLDRTHADWLTVTVAMLDQAQRAGVHLTAAYVAGYVGSELGERVSEIPHVDESRFAGLAQDGRSLEEALAPTVITVKKALKDGKPPADALHEGMTKAVRLASSAVMAAPRGALMDQIQTHPMIVGWQRVTRGGCGACLASAARGYDKGHPLRVHDHCHCTAEPVVRDVPDMAPRSTGPEIFHRMTAAEQDAALGPHAAQLVRNNEIRWSDLIAVSPMKVGPDFITQAPVEALA